MHKPIKRHKAIQPVSREHHHGLLLSWKIRQGLKLNISTERVCNYLNWFWEHYLKPHFEVEENYIFPILGSNNQLVIQALEEHQKIKDYLLHKRLLTANELESLEKLLTEHIRFEERILFNEIEKHASNEQLKRIENIHSDITAEEWKDEFWEYPKK